MMKKIGIVGMGLIGKRLRERLEAQGDQVCFALGRVGSPEVLSGLIRQHRPEIVFLAIPTLDRGEMARDYILACVSAGVPIITCEKGALAYHADVLKSHLGLFRFSAAVSGGVQVIPYLQSRYPNRREVEVHAVLNGTLNFVFDEVARGRGLGESCQEAARLGYAEPGSRDPLTLINGELRDVAMKVCVLFNTAFTRDAFLTPDDLGNFQLTRDQLEDLEEKAGSRRLVVSFSNRETIRLHSFAEGHFEVLADGWHIQGGFRDISREMELLSWIPGGVGNAVHVVEGALGAGGKYTLSGPGAGAEPTTSAMLNDLNFLGI